MWREPSPLVYWKQARASSSSLTEPYLPIHQVRAQVAYECAVTRALCGLVLSKLADGDYPEVNAEVLLHIGTTGLPSSEPAFRYHGRRRLEVTMRSQTKGKFMSTSPYQHIEETWGLDQEPLSSLRDLWWMDGSI